MFKSFHDQWKKPNNFGGGTFYFIKFDLFNSLYNSHKSTTATDESRDCSNVICG